MAGDGKKGMETAKVADIADRLAQAQRELAEAATMADRVVANLRSSWKGEDAQAFYTAWPARRDKVTEAAKGVGAMEKLLRRDIGEQDLASAVSGGGEGGGNGSGDGTGDSDGDGTPDNRDDDDDNDGTPDNRDGDDDNDGTPDSKDKEEDPAYKGKVETPLRERGGNDDTREYTDRGDPDGRDGRGGDDRDDHDRTYRNKDGGDWERGRDYQRTWGNEPDDLTMPGDEEKPGSPKAEANVNLVQGKYEKTFGPQGTLGDRDGNYIGYDVGRVEAQGQAGVTFNEDGVKAGASASAAVMAASVSAQYKNSYGTSASGKAYVGAEANADVGVGIGKDGVNAGVNAEAFAGGKAEANVSQAVGPVDLGVGAEVSYGIGAHANIDAGITKDHVGVSVDIGATLGLGAGVKFDIGFDPPDVDLNPTHWF